MAIEWELAAEQVLISLDVTTPNESALIRYSGDANTIAMVKRRIQQECGMFGHRIGNATTAVDLNVALSAPALVRFSPKLKLGSEIIQNYKLDIPSGAVT